MPNCCVFIPLDQPHTTHYLWDGPKTSVSGEIMKHGTEFFASHIVARPDADVFGLLVYSTLSFAEGSDVASSVMNGPPPQISDEAKGG